MVSTTQAEPLSARAKPARIRTFMMASLRGLLDAHVPREPRARLAKKRARSAGNDPLAPRQSAALRLEFPGAVC